MLHTDDDTTQPSQPSQAQDMADSGEELSLRQGLLAIGVASSTGGRREQDDRSQAFSFVVGGRRITVGAVLDGHHGSVVSELASSMLPTVLSDAVRHSVAAVGDLDAGIERGLHECIMQLDTAAFSLFRSNYGATTGGTTLLVLLIVLETGTARCWTRPGCAPARSHSPTRSLAPAPSCDLRQVFTCNVGDCKAVVSVRGKAEPLNEPQNPPVLTEKRRFEEAGVDCFNDHIGGSDINVGPLNSLKSLTTATRRASMTR